jgi:hypothetical protein
MATTVTVTASNGVDQLIAWPVVVTDAMEAVPGYAPSAGAFGAPSWSITPDTSGSFVAAGVYTAAPGAAGLTPATNNSTLYSGVTSGSTPYWYGEYTGTVTGGTAITLGGTNGTSDWQAWAAYAFPPNGGTPALDGSTPAPVLGSDSSVSVGPFSPPSGAVIGVLILTNSDGAPGFAVSDTSGLTWTQRGTTRQANFEGSSAVFTATNGGGPTNISAQFASAMAARAVAFSGAEVIDGAFSSAMAPRAVAFAGDETGASISAHFAVSLAPRAVAFRQAGAGGAQGGADGGGLGRRPGRLFASPGSYRAHRKWL